MVDKRVKYWLLIGLVMVFIQVIVGGITRLTESGLSITKWEIVAGSLPPLSEESWQREFDLYKNTPQYREINEGMSMGDFKFIYFWEWIHRFWARWMGFVFLFPFIYFLYKRLLDNDTLKRLGSVILLAIGAATFGWIMVASGLINRPWVNAYKLSLHLCIAFSVYACLLYTFVYYIFKNKQKIENKNRLVARKLLSYFLVVLWLQLFFGGVMSGMKAGVYFPTWPDINGEYIPQLILNNNQWNVDNFNNYDSNLFIPSLIHFIHRSTAYILLILGVYIFYKFIKFEFITAIKKPLIYFFGMLITQVILGIITVLMCKGEVPVSWGVLHQAGALGLLTTVMFLRMRLRFE